MAVPQKLIIVLLSILAAASAVPLPILQAVQIERDAPPHYDFSYSVHDGHTGDIKEQHESRKDDVVQGSYSLIDPDGYQRIVQYTADDHNGFNAIVQRQPTNIKVPIATKIISTPIHYSSPIAKIAHYAPVTKYISSPVVHKVIAPTILAKHDGITHVTFRGTSAAYQY